MVLNPGSRNGGRAEELRRLLEERLPGADVRLTVRAGHASELAGKAVEEGFGTIVAAGGDGTVSEVVNGLAGRFEGVRFGLLPLGTGNDLARTLGIPAEPEEALAVLAAGRIRRLDVGRLESPDGERHFVNLANGGFSGRVSERMTPEVKRAWGPLAYLRVALETLPEVAGHRVSLTLDDEAPLEVEALNVVVANGRYVAAGIPIAPRADPGDGRFDVVVLEDRPLPALTALAARILAGTHLDEDEAGEAGEAVLFRRARRVEVLADPPMPFNADGEGVGTTPLAFEVLPRVLEVLVGPEPAAA